MTMVIMMIMIVMVMIMILIINHHFKFLWKDMKHLTATRREKQLSECLAKTANILQGRHQVKALNN